MCCSKDDRGEWSPFAEMYTDVQAYGADASFRCFHIPLPNGISERQIQLQIRVSASTGTALMSYHGYGSDDAGKSMMATTGPVAINVNDLGDASLLSITMLAEIVINREPYRLDQVSEIFKFL
jgi:hypothetical protein